jgi:hypothetical protein
MKGVHTRNKFSNRYFGEPTFPESVCETKEGRNMPVPSLDDPRFPATEEPVRRVRSGRTLGLLAAVLALLAIIALFSVGGNDWTVRTAQYDQPDHLTDVKPDQPPDPTQR